MFEKMKNDIICEIEEIKKSGLYKDERTIYSRQGAEIKVKRGEVLNFCANNYLGLSSYPRVIEAAKKSLVNRGYGLSSVRFICGTQDIHKELEAKLTEFMGTEDTILYNSCFDANIGLFSTLLTDKDAVISDSLNHASIIDGIRLCKADRFRYKHSDMNNLEENLKKAQKHRYRLIVTDGVFSMDGDIAKLPEICDLAEKYDAIVTVDDSHATGVLGKNGRGSHEYHNVIDRIDIITSTLGKALGGATGGFTTGRKEIIEKLRQFSRPYLFSNSVAPVIVATAMDVLNIMKESSELRGRLKKNTEWFRREMKEAGFIIIPNIHPIVPVMFGHIPNDAKFSQDFADALLEEGIYVIGFYYPVVPKGKSRIRVQISAAHTDEHIKTAIEKFIKIRDRFKKENRC